MVKISPINASMACPDCGVVVIVPVTVRLSLESDDNVPVVLVSAEPDTDAAWSHYEEFHMGTGL